ncbi:hypothetical protein RQP46_004935 [Phenoliferia psychrophenolica]
MSARATDPWWKSATIYQVYPASFMDSDADGRGDLQGILTKLDYIKDIGVDCVWISPFFKSPQVDQGYDISDYQDVDPPFGTVADADAIIAGCHSRGMKILFDLVINHCSSEHPWFKESRSSKDNPKRDWFHWKPAKFVDGVRCPPNNWKASFGGSVWEWDELTEEYYLHYYEVQQPDFNWENPETREALYQEAIVFWLEKGVDGFRIDTVNKFSKHLDFPDAEVVDPNNPCQPARHYFNNGPRIHEFIAEMKEKAFKPYGQASLLSSVYSAGLADHTKLLPFVRTSAKELDISISFNLALCDMGAFQNFFLDSQQLINPENDAWAVNCTENHDLARSVSRFACDEPEWRVPSAKMLATYLLTLSGTPIIYQGQELGAINIPKEWSIEEYKDVFTQNFWAGIQRDAKHDPGLLKRGTDGIKLLARDHARVPMSWTAVEPHGGFSTTDGPTWMRANDSFRTINVAAQEDDPKSSLAFYRKLLALRKEHRALFVFGLFELVETGQETFVFVKRAGGDSMVVALNFTKTAQRFSVPQAVASQVALAMSSGGADTPVVEGTLSPFEARIYLPK